MKTPAVPSLLYRLVLAAAMLITSLNLAAEVLAVYPQNSSLEVGSTRQFTAYVPLTNTAIEWLVNDVVGDNATTGTVSASGLYTPPTAIPAPNVVTIKARTPSAIGTTSLTITGKYPWTWSTAPSTVSVGTFQIKLPRRPAAQLQPRRTLLSRRHHRPRQILATHAS